MSPGCDEGRPRQEAPSNVVLTDNQQDTADECRCRVCRRVLKRPESQARGLGWRCAKAIA